MSLEQLLQQVDQLTEDELRQLQEHVERRRREAAEARSEKLMRAFEELREGLTEEQLDMLEWALKYKCVEQRGGSDELGTTTSSN